MCIYISRDYWINLMDLMCWIKLKNIFKIFVRSVRDLVIIVVGFNRVKEFRFF